MHIHIFVQMKLLSPCTEAHMYTRSLIHTHKPTLTHSHTNPLSHTHTQTHSHTHTNTIPRTELVKIISQKWLMTLGNFPICINLLRRLHYLSTFFASTPESDAQRNTDHAYLFLQVKHVPCAE